MAHEKVVTDLITKINASPKWLSAFNAAIASACASNISEMAPIKYLSDYYDFLDSLLLWVPCEDFTGTDVYNHFCLFYFVLDQPSIKPLQTPILPGPNPEELSWLSNWMVQYANAMGQFLDTPESITEESLKSFRESPNYNMGDYLEPRGGWRTFNELFARNFKPGYRPIAAISDPTVITSPADSTFDGLWEIRSDSGVTIKSIHWKISELLEGSPYQDRFNNGIFTHAFLSPNDYHRQHAPVGGRVLEARTVRGQVYLEVNAKANEDGNMGLVPQRKLHNPKTHAHHHAQKSEDEVNGNGNGNGNGEASFDAPDNAGYQFCQARGLVVLDTAIGLVAVLPMGMAQVSSIILTAEVGMTLRKGEEISYFQFGGSDIVCVFEARSNVSVTAQVGVHYKMGTRIAQAFPAGVRVGE
jgi:phosphatidylserine decarboxylase